MPGDNKKVTHSAAGLSNMYNLFVTTRHYRVKVSADANFNEFDRYLYTFTFNFFLY